MGLSKFEEEEEEEEIGCTELMARSQGQRTTK